MVRAEEVDGRVEAPGALVDVIGRVGREVRHLAVGLDEHPVLVVAEVGGAQPCGPVELEDVPLLAQPFHATLHGTRVVQRALGVPRVEVRAEELEHLLLLRKLQGVRRLAKRDELLVLWQGEELRMLGDDARGEVRDVGTVVAVLGDGSALSDGHHRGTKAVHLHAAVIDVELGRDLRARGREHAGESVAHRGPAGVTQVQRPGGVRGDELDVDASTGQEAAAPVIGARLHDLPCQRPLGVGSETDIDEARPGDLRLGDPRHPVEARCHQCGDLPGRLPGRLGEREGHRRRIVPVVAVLGPLDDDFGGRLSPERPLGLQRQDALAHRDGQILGSHDRSVIVHRLARL